ncbi:MAG: YbaB/EbfC family nucleoid-associated protein [Eubacteriales bacterium]|nr:YbaB/EbfC family nucleoid-associated protein [Bacillota bacterium]MBV1727982.1 YbaB/EbfC family nucleoid-associated protein [Desulforudis sp.]MDP3051167.1 YbaB/EbfC family nucleoid-associated protein [Eubacteriales bacterium]MDQ7789903.1 YbaB/EbfC family nucleoid-associated protein [Clostridia bacterium]MBU4532977.1 YbaB/EbfC family nucleoid-associated protein [Bacillota bacterium]
MLGMNKMMKQVQKLQADMMRMQEELGERTVEATAGGGVVKVVADGKQEIRAVVISPEAVDPEDVEMLQDLVLAATNEALRLSREMVSTEMAKITGGINMPPGLF